MYPIVFTVCHVICRVQNQPTLNYIFELPIWSWYSFTFHCHSLDNGCRLFLNRIFFIPTIVYLLLFTQISTTTMCGTESNEYKSPLLLLFIHTIDWYWAIDWLIVEHCSAFSASVSKRNSLQNIATGIFKSAHCVRQCASIAMAVALRGSITLWIIRKVQIFIRTGSIAR